jgi:hypothetical protein
MIDTTATQMPKQATDLGVFTINKSFDFDKKTTEVKVNNQGSE